jgi:hypothetical protein
MPRKVILLEFNELSPSLLDRWMAEGRLPNFKRFYDRSHVFTTVADETDPDYLEPWIQWYSLHTGLGYRQHGVFHLTDGPKASHKDIWQRLAENGLKVGNCGSMNARALRAADSFYLPDPWCTSEIPHPAELAAFHKVVTNRVQENSTAGTGALSLGDQGRFLAFLMSHGLRLSTLWALASQLWSDTLLRQHTTWKRVVLLDKMQMDLFRYYWRRYQPDFSTFFLNSTAHYQHGYWHCLYPESFASPVEPVQLKRFGGAILFGYQQMDRLLEEFFEFERQDVMLILSTALSQHANTRTDRPYYRPKDAPRLLAALGIHPEMLQPVMSEQYSARFADQSAADDARKRLEGLSIGGLPLFDFAPAPPNTVFFGCDIHEAIDDSARIEGLDASFFDIFYVLPHTKTGVHHPDGVLWIKSGEHRVHTDKVSILDVVPTLLEHFGIDRHQADSTGQMQGRSLLPLLRGATTIEAVHPGRVTPKTAAQRGHDA